MPSAYPKPRIAAILAADWGKSAAKRAVYVAETATRRVRRLDPDEGWSVTSLMDRSLDWRRDSAVVVAIDAPLGVPVDYFARVGAELGLPVSGSFLDLLDAVSDDYFTVVRLPEQWRLQQPFFSVLAGKDGLDRFRKTAGCRLLRLVDLKTGAKSPFIASGIPGSVGSGAIELWRELKSLRSASPRAPDLKVWPFDGALAALTSSNQVVLAETYPRACYSIALDDGLAGARPIWPLAKTQRAVRRAAIERLRLASWVMRAGVELADLEAAEASEDDFDALMAAVALLRMLEVEPEAAPHQGLELETRIEGGILGLEAVDLDARWVRHPLGRLEADPQSAAVSGHQLRRWANPRMISFACPIPGCKKVFERSRGGWDAHVGSLRVHPEWRPTITDPAERRHAFEVEFRAFFE